MDGKGFRKLQQAWYDRLAKEGFKDIEDGRYRDQPLKEWHSFKFVSEKIQLRQARVSEYLEKAEGFLHSPPFEEICTLLVKHKGSALEVGQVRIVWELHCLGLSERGIAKELKRSKTCIHFALKRMRAWMHLL